MGGGIELDDSGDTSRLETTLMTKDFKRNARQLKVLKVLLSSALGRSKLVESLIPIMKRRKNVDIDEICDDLRDVLGERWAIWAYQCLLEAADKAGIPVINSVEQREVWFREFWFWWMMQATPRLP
jgi:hypothetical protein